MRVALVIAAAVLSIAAAPQVTLPDVEDEVMCVACGTALNISQAPSADRERALIRRLIARGLDKDQIKDALVIEYGPKVLAEPRQSAAWVIPAVIAAAALLGVGFTVRRWRSAGSTPSDEHDALADEDAERLERDMAAYRL